jgi:hypothetical protein
MFIRRWIQVPNHKCPSHEDISRYLESELNEEETGRIEEHLEKCSDCKEFEISLKRISKELLALPAVSVSPEFTQKVMERTKKEKMGSEKNLLNQIKSLVIVIGTAVLLGMIPLNSNHETILLTPVFRGIFEFFSDPVKRESFDIIFRGVSGMLQIPLILVFTNIVLLSVLAAALWKKRIPVKVMDY